MLRLVDATIHRLTSIAFAFVLALATLLASAATGRQAEAQTASNVRVYVLSGAGTGVYTTNQTIPISAVAPPSGYIFAYWQIYGGQVAQPTASSTTLTVTPGARYVIAIARRVQAPLTTGAQPLTVYNGTGSGSYVKGQSVSISANSLANGYVFSHWNDPYRIVSNTTVPNTTLVAPGFRAFVYPSYRPAAIARVAVTITGGTPSGTYGVGSKVNIKANAPAAGQVFDKWTGGIAALANPALPDTVLTVPAQAVAVAAAYKPAPAAKVAITITNGTPSGTYDVGAKVNIKANTAPTDQIFDKWTGATSTLANPALADTVLTVPSTPATVTATYRPTANSSGVTLTSHKDGDPISDQGATVFGTVTNPATVDTLTATISTTGRTTALDVDPASGRFALRLFAEDAPAASNVALTFSRKDKSTVVQTGTFTLKGASVQAGMQQALGRLTFGATPALLNTINTIGYTAWVNQQLNPSTISDASLVAMNPEALLRTADEPWQLRESLPWWQMAYASYSQRQLLEVMTTFWNNHFWSVDTGLEIHMADVEEVKGFRANAFGKFRELLRVSTKNPQMMKYLDNVDSRVNRINENYGRELLELHTVGVNGGYGDADVIAVSRILTGWGLERTTDDSVKPRLTRFLFRPNDHDTKDKFIPFLNMTITGRTGAAGEQEGEELLDTLARHPKTREFVCGKIVGLLVSDSRPANFVTLCSTTWANTDGSIKDVLQAILTAPDYLTTVDHQRSKAKTPYEYMTGFVRNFGVYPVQGKERDFYNSLRVAVRDAGMDMIEFGVPTGFREAGGAWTNTASFIQKFRSAASQVTRQTNAGSGNNRQGVVSFSQLIKDADMKTAQAAAAYLLALGTADRFRKDEYDEVVAALKGTQGFNPSARDEEAVLRKAVGLIVVLPSYQLQ